MYFDYAILAFMLWGVSDAILYPNDNSDDSTDETDLGTQVEPENTSDGGDLLDTPANDSTDDTFVDDTSDNDTDEIIEDYVYVSGPTTVTVQSDGETSTSTFQDVEFGIAPTVSGTEDRDTIDASTDTGFALNINAGAGDDTVNFGYGAWVNGGDGTDILSLTVTQNALASDTDVGQINMTDPQDALNVTFEPQTPDFVHTVRGQTTQTVNGVTTRTDWIDYYVSDTQDLGADDLSNDAYAPDDATHVFRAILGSGTDVINADPAITVNRPVASSSDVTR